MTDDRLTTADLPTIDDLHPLDTYKLSWRAPREGATFKTLATGLGADAVIRCMNHAIETSPVHEWLSQHYPNGWTSEPSPMREIELRAEDGESWVFSAEGTAQIDERLRAEAKGDHRIEHGWTLSLDIMAMLSSGRGGAYRWASRDGLTNEQDARDAVRAYARWLLRVADLAR